MSHTGRWWRAIVAVLLLGGGLWLWTATGDGPAPWSRRGARSTAETAAVTDDDALDESDETEPATATGEPVAAPQAPGIVDEVAPEPIPVTDFFAAPPPEPLGRALARLKAGARLPASDVKALMAYDEEHPGDPRVQLLFAYDSMKLDWKRAAIGHYLQAYRSEPRAREDARMLPDLIALVGDAREGELAADAIQEIFGVDALPGIEDAIADAHHERFPEAAARLTALAERLRR